MRRAILAGAALALVIGLPAQGKAQQRPTGVRGEVQAQIDMAGDKLLQLAEAIPADKYGWRPGEGVRSVSEVFMHVAGGNYLFTRTVGATLAAPFGRDAETTMTDKAQVMDQLKSSFAHVHDVVGSVPEADLDKMASFFGQPMTYRGVLLALASHDHEHLGQMIAYARMNGIVPPWSRPEPAQ